MTCINAKRAVAQRMIGSSMNNYFAVISVRDEGGHDRPREEDKLEGNGDLNI